MGGSKNYKPSFKTIKRNTIKTAKELFYSKEIIDKLENAETEAELHVIMRNARLSL